MSAASTLWMIIITILMAGNTARNVLMIAKNGSIEEEVMNVILYTTNCPKCKVLEAKLQQKNITFQTVEDEQVMINKGFLSAPMLEVDDQIYDFSGAINWIKGV